MAQENSKEQRPEIEPIVPDDTTKYLDPSLVGKYMVDPATGLAGLWRSPDNGKTWVLTDTVYGHVYGPDEADNFWKGDAGHKVKDEIDKQLGDLPNVKSAADSAVKAAESAIAASKVNSDANKARDSAIAEAKAAADSAAVEIQQVMANASSDAAAIREHVAKVENEVNTAKTANESTVAEFKADISSAKENLATVNQQLAQAQSAVENTQKAINSNVADINKQIATNTADIKQAQSANSAVATQLDTYTKQAQEQQKTIKSVLDTQDGFSATLADVKGNVSQVQDAVTGLTASLKDTQDNVATVKAQADGLNATLTDQQKNVTDLLATAKELRTSLSDAQGRLSTVEQTSSEQSTTLSDLQGDLSQVKQTATSVVDTLKDAQNNITQLQTTAKGQAEQISNAQGDITAIQKTVDGLNATITSHDKSIHTLQVSADGFTSDIKDAKGNISSLQSTVKSLTSTMSDTQGRVSKVEQTASSLNSSLADAKGNITNLQQTTSSLQSTLSDAQKDINNIKIDATGMKATLTTQGNDIAQVKASATSLSSRLSGVETESKNNKDKLDNLQAGGKNLIRNSDANASGAYAWNNTLFNKHSFYYNGTKYMFEISNATSTEVTSGSQWFSIKPGKQYTFSMVAFASNNMLSYDVWLLERKSGETGSYDNAYQIINGEKLSPSHAETVVKTFTVPADYDEAYIRIDNNKSTDGKDALLFFNEVQLKAGNIYTGYSPNPDDLADKITTNSTAIDQNKKAIALKADQSTVNNLSGEVSKANAQLQVQADQISSKVSSEDFKTLKSNFDNLQIGGRNYLRNSDKSTTNGWAVDLGTIPNDVLNSLAGKKIIISADVEWSNYKQDSSKQNRLGFELSVSGSDGKSYWFGVWKSPSTASGKERISTSYSLATGVSYTISNNSKSGYVSINGTGKVSRVKIEIGNKATDWTPAPEDAMTEIQKNSTAIDQTNKQVAIKANQTDVDAVKKTAQNNASQLSVFSNEVKSKVDSTTVNNIVNGKGFATQSTVQSLIDQRAGTLSESITNLTTELENNGGGVNLLRNTGTLQFTANVVNSSNNPNSGDTLWHLSVGYLDDWLRENPKITKLGISYDYELTGANTATGIIRFGVNQTPAWEYISGYNLDGKPLKGRAKMLINVTDAMRKTHTDITRIRGDGLPIGATLKITNPKWEIGAVTPYSQAPSDNATVTQLQSITASIDGLQSNVTNFQNNTNSQFTQLSNVMQSKVGSADFNALKQRVDMQTLDSADINNMKTNGRYFVRNLANNPISGWVYVDVTGNGSNRIRQDVYQDSGNQHKYRRWFGTSWTGWSQGAEESEITQLKDAINLRITKGDLMSQINLSAGNTLIQSNKLYLDSSSTVFSGKAFIPSAAIASLDADKINTGTLNTNNVKLGDGSTRLWATGGKLYLTGSDQGDSYNMRISGDALEFVTNKIPNSLPYMNGITPMYDIRYDGGNKSRLKVRSFNALTSSKESPVEMYDSINVSKDELDFAANNQMRMMIEDGGVHIRPSLFFENKSGTGGMAGFTRADNSNTVEFNTADNNSENFHVNSGARFMQYVYINGYARAQGWLTNSTLSKKTNIRKLDTLTALNKIRQDDQYLYEYKRNVAQGIYDPQASFIIDDVHDVSQYSVPREFIDQSGNYREPNVELAYLIAAFQELDKEVQELKEKLSNE